MATKMTRILRDVPLRQIPVVEPQTDLEEATRLLEDEPLHAVALVGDETYMGIFNQDALESGLIPRRVDRSTIAVGPYVHTYRAEGSPQMPVEQALMHLERRGANVLPVVDGVRYLGVVTREDLENALG